MAISFKSVTHAYPGMKKKEKFIAIKDVDLDIDASDEFVSIVGKTGSGKSTLIQHMNGLLSPTSGTVTLFDSVFTSKVRKNPKLKPVRKRIGFVFQFPEYQLFEETVLKDIMFAPKNFGFSQEEAKSRALEVCKLLNIDSSLLDKSPFNLSGGQMRKVAIAGILAYDPDILLLDEPTRGLDPLGAKEIMEVFNEIHTKMHKTIVLISHDMNIVYNYSTRIVVMADGVKVYDGDKVDMFKTFDYKAYHLDLPDVLKLKNYLNETLGYNIPDTIYNEDMLIEFLKKEEIKHE